MEATKARLENVPDLATFWSRLRGWNLAVRAGGAEHASYTDLEVIVAQAASALGLSAAQVAEQLGTLAPARAVAIQRAYSLAFFDRHLRRKGHLLDRPSRITVTCETPGLLFSACLRLASSAVD
ncbi:hypothetical protein AB0K16_44860 [Nonomuraea jabiensis]|uniref:hypothetical protein n=1 Tax=Nonomuraea jabiensis TaxID=882448 RepID=UPI00344905D7